MQGSHESACAGQILVPFSSPFQSAFYVDLCQAVDLGKRVDSQLQLGHIVIRYGRTTWCDMMARL
jgi:hypothetical protein